MNLNEMKVGQVVSSENVEISASIDEASYKTRVGTSIPRKAVVTINRGDIAYGEFVIHRVLGQSFILLSEKGKKKNLSLLEKIDLMFKTYKNLL